LSLPSYAPTRRINGIWFHESVESLKAVSLQVFGIEARSNCRDSIIMHCMTPVNARKTPGRMRRMINDAVNVDRFTPKVRRLE